MFEASGKEKRRHGGRGGRVGDEGETYSLSQVSLHSPTLKAKALLVPFLVDSDAHVNMGRKLASGNGRTRNDALQPSIASVLVVLIILIPFLLLARRRIQMTTTFGSTAHADQATLLARPAEQVRDGAASRRLDEHHPTDGWTDFSGKKSEDGVGTARVEGVGGENAVAATAVFMRVDLGGSRLTRR